MGGYPLSIHADRPEVGFLPLDILQAAMISASGFSA